MGELLAAEGDAYAIVILGGAALNLLGVVQRATIDVDIVAVGLPEDRSSPRQIAEPPRPLPDALMRANDLIFFKLFAAADDSGTDSVHYQDLLALNPTASELDAAAAWVRGQDASDAFAEILAQVVTHVRRSLDVRP